MTTDTTEKGLEALIVRHMTGQPPAVEPLVHTAQLVPGHYAVGGYVQGHCIDYNRDVAVDVAQLLAFLQATQPKLIDSLELANSGARRQPNGA